MLICVVALVIFRTRQKLNFPIERKMSVFVTDANWLMPFKEIRTVHSENQTTAPIKLCGQNAEFLNPKVDSITYSRSPQQQLRQQRVFKQQNLYLYYHLTSINQLTNPSIHPRVSPPLNPSILYSLVM